MRIPYHKHRKFSAVTGTTSANNSNTIRPARSPSTSTSKKQRGFGMDRQVAAVMNVRCLFLWPSGVIEWLSAWLSTSRVCQRVIVNKQRWDNRNALKISKIVLTRPDDDNDQPRAEPQSKRSPATYQFNKQPDSTTCPRRKRRRARPCR